MAAAPSLADLRQLLAARFPASVRRAEALVPTGVAALDEALGGGLPGGAFTELVCAPSRGGGLALAGLIAETRKARQRLALLDAADGFSPEDLPSELLEHIVWCRCGRGSGGGGGVGPSATGREAASFWLVADLILRDAHFAAAVLDLRGVPERILLRTPGSTWYRLQRAVEQSAIATLVLSAVPVVPGVRHRLRLETSHRVRDLRAERETLVAALAPRQERSRGALHLSSA